MRIYAQFGPIVSNTRAVGMVAEKGLLYAFLQNLMHKILAFDLIIFSLFAFYLGMEIYRIRQNLKANLLELHKRFVLLVFLIPFFCGYILNVKDGLSSYTAVFRGRVYLEHSGVLHVHRLI